MGLRRCCRCKEAKPQEGFYPSMWNRPKHGIWCKSCHQAYGRARTPEQKRRGYDAALRGLKRKYDWAWDYKQQRGCLDCGERHPACLDFHHRDQATKTMSVSECCRSNLTLDKILAEIAKCDLLCANCHRKRHYADKSGGFASLSDKMALRRSRLRLA